MTAIWQWLDWFQLWKGGVYQFDKTDEWVLQDKTGQEQKIKARRLIRCAYCNYPITDRSAAIEIAGQHHHVFTNPGGITYEISLYHSAECVQHGIATTEYTWFHGCAWQVALCGNCKSHLGWRYTRADREGFYGLISEHIVEL